MPIHDLILKNVYIIANKGVEFIEIKIIIQENVTIIVNKK